uniref:Uncharacterized protein n=1 Tax=Octopus bimaculoides TaxID=37653 RepID=A0A0L8GKY2_OCTBM
MLWHNPATCIQIQWISSSADQRTENSWLAISTQIYLSSLKGRAILMISECSLMLKALTNMC